MNLNFKFFSGITNMGHVKFVFGYVSFSHQYILENVTKIFSLVWGKHSLFVVAINSDSWKIFAIFIFTYFSVFFYH